MASVSSGHHNSGLKPFDFANDDILCTYRDYANQESSNGTQFDPSIGTNPCKDFQKSRVSQASVSLATNVFNLPEESLHQEMISTVERTMKKYVDNLMRFLEGISSRLSQLELYCYNLDKSIGEMRSELDRDNGEADSKLKSLEKHLQEVHRSLQILRDKQELAETQKELAKLQFAQKDSSAVVREERTAVSATESKKTNDANDTSNTQLALALPNQVAPQSSQATVQQQATDPSALPLSQNLNQEPTYYLPPTQLPNPQSQTQHSYVPADAQCRATHLGPEAYQQSQTQVNQTPQTQQFPHYQQWSQQANQPVQQPQPPPLQLQNQVRPQSLLSSVYHPYVGAQPTNYPGPLESMASSMPMKVSFPGIPQKGVSRSETMPYSYGGSGRPVQSQPSPQHLKGGFPSQPGDGYTTNRSRPPMTSRGTYMLYDNEGAWPHLSPQSNHYSHDTYSTGHAPLPTLLTNNTLMIHSPSSHFVHNHPHNELIDKLASMGFRGDHVVGVIQRLEDSGQPVDFNAVLDRLNGHPSGGSQGAW